MLSTILGLLAFAILAGLSSCKDDQPEPENQAPVIQSISANPNSSSSNRIPGGTVVQLTIVATDPDKDTLTYTWSANEGQFTTDTDKATVSWMAPQNSVEKNYDITVAVSDGEKAVSSQITTYIAKTLTGKVEGYAYYASTTIPISGVLISVGDKTSTTGSNGFYQIQGALVGNHTLTATKECYDSYSTNIEIHFLNNFLNIEMTSALYTHDLFGIVKSNAYQFGSGPLSFCTVVVLNPNGSESNLMTQTSSTGYYQIPTVPQGNRIVRFKHPEHETIEINIFMDNSNYELDVIINKFFIGMSFQGGKIAYIIQPGDPGYIEGEIHGLIAAPSDQGGATWGCSGTTIGGTSTAFGAGAANTTAIVAGCSTAGIAARLCDDHELNGYSDWFLPSKDELNNLYQNKTLIGGFSFSLYWSSSEYSSYSAWLQDFGSGSQFNDDFKFGTCRVRAVRAF